MKKKYCLIFIVTVSVLCLCACNNLGTSEKKSGTLITNGELSYDANHSESVTNGVKEKEIVYEITTNSDYNKLAFSFDELIRDADLIMKISIQDTVAFIGSNGMIQTEITPVVKEIYKGSYHNEKLYVNGGEMLYEEFSENEIIKNAISGHENPNGDTDLSGKYVRQIVDEQYILSAGEEYIFFAQKREDTKQYYSLYAYQGTYKITEGMVENIALNNDEQLKCDLNAIFSNSSETPVISVNENNALITTEDNFTQKIKDFN